MKNWLVTGSIALAVLLGCQKQENQFSVQTESTQSLRELTKEERAQDFDQLLGLFKSYYGPYQFKEKLLGINIEKIHAELKAKALNAASDEEFAGYVMQFGAFLRDGHVQIQVKNTASGVLTYNIPIVLTPVEGKALIGDISKELADYTGFQIGDEVLEVDGKSPFEILKTVLKYRSTASDQTNDHSLIFVLSRPSYMAELIPTQPMVRLKVKTAKGEIKNTEVAWDAQKYNKVLDTNIPKPTYPFDFSVGFADEMNSIIEGHRKQIGAVDPFFATNEVLEKYKFVKVYPSLEMRKKHGLADAETPPIYAALYKFNGKTILLARIATYAPADYKPALYLKAYSALFEEYQDIADVLVLDQNHNPGGNGWYCSSMFNFFAQDGDVQSVQQCRADRKWVTDLYTLVPPAPGQPEANPWDIKIEVAWGQMVEKAYDQGQFLSEPIPFFTGQAYATPASVQWKKPVMVLADELAGSCGDIFPMLIKANKRAKIFGQPTMGLGGNVEEVGVLSNSRIAVRMTRGLFSPYQPNGIYANEVLVENNGIKPDIYYTHTVEDFRNRFVDYVQKFSEKAVEQIQ